jgi:hypothetical protein
MNEIDKFVSELRRNPRSAPYTDGLVEAFAAVIDEGNINGEALEFMDGIEWITKRHVSLAERVRALTEYMSLRGKVRVKLRCHGDRIIMKRI